MVFIKHLAFGVATVSAFTLTYYGTRYSIKYFKKLFTFPRVWREIGQVTDIYCFPIKSGGAVCPQEISPGELGWRNGLLSDRCFMIINAKTRKFVTAREHPEFSMIVPTVIGVHTLSLGATTRKTSKTEKFILDMATVLRTPKTYAEIWDELIEVHDCGDAVARWLALVVPDALDGLRLVYTPKGIPTLPVRPKEGQAVWPNEDDYHTDDTHDPASYTMLNLASLDYLNSKMETHVSPLWFRPSIVVKLNKNMKPYAEDKISWYRFGESAIFHRVEPCRKCEVATFDPDIRDMDTSVEPMKTLVTIRKPPRCGVRPILGAQLEFLEGDGPVKRHDKVYVGSFV